jgi:protein Mpv17
MKANWAVWPLANLINFALIPPEQRILYVNVLAVGGHEAINKKGGGL